MSLENLTTETFGIYYLNYPKVMDINTSIDNRRRKSFNVKNSSASSSSNIASASAQMGVHAPLVPYHAEAGVTMQHSADLTSSTGITEYYEIKDTKSTELKQLLAHCETCGEGIADNLIGKLVRINEVQFRLIDDNVTLALQALRHDALKGMRVQGIDISDMVNSIIHDYAYILIGCAGLCEFAVKIPSESTAEFENKYSIHDLLIGKVSVVGVYKGLIPVDQLRSSTLSLLQGQESSNASSKVILSSVQTPNSHTSIIAEQSNSMPTEIGYIDTIAIIQPIELSAPLPSSQEEEGSEKPLDTSPVKQSLWQRIKLFFTGDANA